MKNRWLGVVLGVVVGYALAPQLPRVLADVIRASGAVGPGAGGGGGGDGAATSITVGTTTITSGTATRVLFDSAGVIGEDADFTFLTDTLTVTKLANVTVPTGGAVRTGTTASDTLLLQAYDTDTGPAYTTFGTLTAGTAPSLSFGTTSFTGETTLAGGAILNTQGVTNSTLNGSLILFTTADGLISSHVTAITPDVPAFMTGTISNAFHIFEFGDIAFDFTNALCGTAACINPQFIVHDKDQNTTDYQSLGLSGLTGKFTTTLVSTVATAVVEIPVAAEASTSGELLYTVHATDGATPQTRSGRVIFNANNDGGTETCVLGTPEELDNTPTGTLTATISCVVGLTNVVRLAIAADSSLAETTLEAYGTLILVGAGEPLPQ